MSSKFEYVGDPSQMRGPTGTDHRTLSVVTGDRLVGGICEPGFMRQKDGTFLRDTSGYPELHVRVANHKAGSVSSRNFNAELNLHNHGVKKMNILELIGNNKQSIKLLHIETNKLH